MSEFTMTLSKPLELKKREEISTPAIAFQVAASGPSFISFDSKSTYQELSPIDEFDEDEEVLYVDGMLYNDIPTEDDDLPDIADMLDRLELVKKSLIRTINETIGAIQDELANY